MRTKPCGAARKSFSITSPSSRIPSPCAQRLEACCRHSLIVAQGVGSAREGVQRRHLVHPVSLVRSAPGAVALRMPRAGGAVLRTALGAASHQAPCLPLLHPTPQCAPVPVAGGTTAASHLPCGGPFSILPSQGRSPSAAGRPCDPSASCRRRSTRSPPPTPALGLQVNEMLVFLSHLFCFPAKF